MSQKTDLRLREVFGCPADGATKTINSSTGATATSTSLAANCTYRIACTEDAHIIFSKVAAAATSTTDMLMFGGVPEVFATDNSFKFVHALAKLGSGTQGVVYITKLTE